MILTYSVLSLTSEVEEGGRYTLSSGRDIVSLTLTNSVSDDTGEWTCSAQMYESGTTLTVGQPVERTIQLTVVGKSSKGHSSCFHNVCRLR